MAVSWGPIASDTRSTIVWIVPLLSAMLNTEAHRACTALRLAPTIPALSPTNPVNRGPYPLVCSEGTDALHSVPHDRPRPWDSLQCVTSGRMTGNAMT